MGSLKMAESRLLTAGHVVGSTDGTMWLVRSSIRTKNGLHFKLADLAGRPVPTPAKFSPVPPRLARLANFLRLAYNPDFDLYVKEYIKAAAEAGSFGEEFRSKPTQAIDPGMNWAKYLHKALAHQFNTTDSELQDEGINHIIHLVLAERKTLQQPRFQEIVDNFTAKNPKFPELPVAKQITTILKSNFWNRGQEGRRYVQEMLQGHDISEGVTEKSFVNIDPESEGGVSPVDRPKYDTGLRRFDDIEEDIEMGDYRGRDKNIRFGRFSHGFREWLLKRLPSPEVRQYMRLLTLLHEEFKSSSSGTLKLEDIEREWVKAQNAHENYRNRWDHDTFEKVFKDDLPRKMETYVRTNTAFHGKEFTLPHVVQILIRHGEELREKGLQESKSDQEGRQKEKDISILPKSFPDAATASVSKQWEAPRCACGEASELKACPTCKERFCVSCYTDHTFNSPGHEKVGL